MQNKLLLILLKKFFNIGKKNIVSIIKTPPVLFWNNFNVLYRYKKYHSGIICLGVK